MFPTTHAGVYLEDTGVRCDTCFWPVSPTKPQKHRNWCRDHKDRKAQCPYCSKVMQAASIAHHVETTCPRDKPGDPKMESSLRRQHQYKLRGTKQPSARGVVREVKPDTLPMQPVPDDDIETVLLMLLDADSIPVRHLALVNEWIAMTRKLLEAVR